MVATAQVFSVERIMVLSRGFFWERFLLNENRDPPAGWGWSRT
jgi:hypothetical protein